MRTEEKYEEMGFIKLGEGKMQDKHGGVYYPRKATKPLKAIRMFCFECMGMDRRDKKPEHPIENVRNCTDPMCPLFDFRFGKNPFVGQPLSEEQRIAAVERLRIGRETQQKG